MAPATPARTPRLTLKQAIDKTGLTQRDIAEALALRAVHTGRSEHVRSDIPAPLAGEYTLEAMATTAKAPAWDPDRFRDWAMMMGYWRPRYQGHHVIGYAGIARLTGLTEQWIKKRRGRAGGEFMPAPVARAGVRPNSAAAIQLFDRKEMIAWLVKVGDLQPDGATPTRQAA
jgi:hypothetical protein